MRQNLSIDFKNKNFVCERKKYKNNNSNPKNYFKKKNKSESNNKYEKYQKIVYDGEDV